MNQLRRIAAGIAVLLAFHALIVVAGCGDDTTAPVDTGSGGGDGGGVTAPGFVMIDTGQDGCYDGNGAAIAAPAEHEAFYGQDAQFANIAASYQDNGDGTVTDLNSGLVWQKSPVATHMTWHQAMDYCDTLTLAGYDDWRAPTLKELFSISDFSQGWPYIDTAVFDLAEPVLSKDDQYWSANFYEVGTTHGGAPSAFGVNHATGHIKAYPADTPGPMGKHVRAVRGGNGDFGLNHFVDNGDGTITDEATGLMWMQAEADSAMDWEHALAYADTLTLAGYDDWRLPDVRERQAIVDYSGVFPAVDPLFSCTPMVNEAGNDDYGYEWTSTSAYFGPDQPEYYYAWYVACGRAVDPTGEDVHGAGAVRFDTKKEGGPLGEGGERYYNFVRCVRKVGS